MIFRGYGKTAHLYDLLFGRPRTSRMLNKPTSSDLISFRPSTGTRPPHHSAARTDLVLLIRRTLRPRGYALYLECMSGYMTAHSINRDVIGRYASGHDRPNRSRAVTSSSAELVQLPGLGARILQGRAKPEAQWERSQA